MTHHRAFIPSNNFGQPCACLVCVADGTTNLETVRVPPDEDHPRWRTLHGAELRAWHDARNRVIAQLSGGPKC